MSEEKKLLEAQLKDTQKAAQAMRDRLDAMDRAEKAASLEPLKATATRAHDLLCPYNHTDGCSWGYEGDSWEALAHSRWLAKIDTITNGNSYSKPVATLSEVNIILDAVEGLKPKVGTALQLLRRDLMA